MDFSQVWLPADAVWSVAYLIAFAGVVVERKTVLRHVRASLPLVPILLLVGLSTLWSNDPATTARRSLALLGTAVIALHFVNRLGLRGFVESLAITIAIAAVASVPLIAFLPSYGLQHGANEAWQGCFFEKNQLGQAMALGIVTTTMLTDGTRGVRRAVLIAFLLLFFVLLVGSQSAGALASTIIFALVLPLSLWIRRTRSSRLALLSALVISTITLAAWISGFDADEAFGVLGRDATFTGRTDIWQASLNAVSERPVLGYGYREFWDPNGDAQYFVSPNSEGWQPNMAHNGFIEVALDIGIVGEGALVLFLAVAAARALASFWRGHDRLSAWPLFAMLDVVLQNLTDRSFATQQSIFWIVFLSAFWFATDACQRGPALLQNKQEIGTRTVC